MDILAYLRAGQDRHRGWLSLATRQLDPHKDNIVTAVSFGPCMFRPYRWRGCRWRVWMSWRAMGCRAWIRPAAQRAKILERFAQTYSPLIGRDEVMQYLGSTG